MKGEVKLTEAQIRVLDQVVAPEASPDADPFLDMRTVNSLLRKGFVRVEPIKRTPGFDTMMAALGCETVVATPAGRRALADLERGQADDQR